MPGFSVGVAGPVYDKKKKTKMGGYSNRGTRASRFPLPPLNTSNREDCHVSSSGWCRGVAWKRIMPWLVCIGVWGATGFIFYMTAFRNRNTCDECPVLNSRGHRDLSMLVLYLRRVALAFGGSLVVISLEDFLPRMGKVTSYLPVDKLSACLFVLGAAQRAQSDLFHNPGPSVSQRQWWFYLGLYMIVCFIFLTRLGRVVLQISGFVLLSRWSLSLKIFTAMMAFVALRVVVLFEQAKPPSDVEPSIAANESYSRGIHRTRATDDIIFRFSLLSLVFIFYPSMKLEIGEDAPADTFQGQDKIGAAVRGGFPLISSWWDISDMTTEDAAFYSGVLETGLFKVCQMSLAFLMARTMAMLPVLTQVIPRCRYSLQKIAEMARKNGFSTTTSRKNNDHGGTGMSVEDMCWRIKLRAIFVSQDATLRLVFLDRTFNLFYRTGQLVSGNKLIFDLDVIDVMEALSYKVVLMGACFILAFARATQEELEDTVFTLLNAQKSWRSSVPLLCRVGVAFAYVSFLVVVSTWVMYTRLDTEGIETMAAMALLAADAGEWAVNVLSSVCRGLHVFLSKQKELMLPPHVLRVLAAFLTACLAGCRVCLRGLSLWACLFQSPFSFRSFDTFWEALEVVRIMLLVRELRSLWASGRDLLKNINLFLVMGRESLVPMMTVAYSCKNPRESCALCLGALLLDTAPPKAPSLRVELTESNGHMWLIDDESEYLCVKTRCCERLCHLKCVREWVSVNTTCPRCNGKLLRGAELLGRIIGMITSLLTLFLYACRECGQLSFRGFLVLRHAGFMWALRRKLRQLKAKRQQLREANEKLRKNIRKANSK